MSNLLKDPLVLLADRIAGEAHASQRRKWADEAYITHPRRVAAAAAELPGMTAIDVAAAKLHDVVEDTDVDESRLAEMLIEGGVDGPEIALVIERVLELTQPYAPDDKLSRADKRTLDWMKLRTVSDAAKRLKMLDRIDNLAGGGSMPSKMLAKYLPESRVLVDILGSADPELATKLTAIIEDLEAKLVKTS